MTDGGRVRVRATEPTDRPRLLELFSNRFGHSISEETWRWKYESTPGVSASWLAETAVGEVLAHAGALGFQARWATGAGVVWQLVDFMGLTGGGGLRAPLVEVGQRLLADLDRPGTADWIFGFPSERHFRLGQRVFGYRTLPGIPLLAGELPTLSGGSEVEVSDHCGGWAEETWKACRVAGIERTAAFLNWRYHARPDRYYRFFRLPAAGGRADGLAVFAFAGTEARAAELWLPEGVEWRPGLLAVAADLRASGMETWSFWPPALRGAAELLAQLGVEASGEVQLMGCCGRADSDPQRAARGFPYSRGDYDAV